MTTTSTSSSFARSRASAAARTAALLALTLGVHACRNDPSVPEGRELVIAKGESFYLEPALDPAKRLKGLGGRESIEPDGGMVFVFTDVAQREFVMRDCVVPIDIAFLSESGRVMTMHAMIPETPMKPSESDLSYEFRLRRYPSRFPTRYAVEVVGGTWDRIGLAEGDVISFDIDGLKARAR